MLTASELIESQPCFLVQLFDIPYILAHVFSAGFISLSPFPSTLCLKIK